MFAFSRSLALPLAVLALVLGALFAFGFLTVTTSLWVAISLTIAAVGLGAVVLSPKKGLGFLLMGAGLAMYLLGANLPPLSVGDALSAGGA